MCKLNAMPLVYGFRCQTPLRASDYCSSQTFNQAEQHIKTSVLPGFKGTNHIQLYTENQINS